MKPRTANSLFLEIAEEMSELSPQVDKKNLSISFKGDFWVNQYFYKQQYTDEDVAALASNLDFIPPDLKDENLRRSLYQKTTGCSLNALFLRAQADKEGKKVQRMEIDRTEPWEGSTLRNNFDAFYLPVLRSMRNARFCIDLLLGEEIEVAGYHFALRYSDDSRLIDAIIGAYYLADLYGCLDTFRQNIMGAAKDSLQYPSERDILERLMKMEQIPAELENLL